MRYFQSIERRPLYVSVFALAFSTPAAALLTVPGYEGWAFDWGAIGVCGVSLSVSILAVINTAKAERRGYSRDRASVSAVTAALSLVPGFLLALNSW